MLGFEMDGEPAWELGEKHRGSRLSGDVWVAFVEV